MSCNDCNHPDQITALERDNAALREQVAELTAQRDIQWRERKKTQNESYINFDSYRSALKEAAELRARVAELEREVKFTAMSESLRDLAQGSSTALPGQSITEWAAEEIKRLCKQLIAALSLKELASKICNDQQSEIDRYKKAFYTLGLDCDGQECGACEDDNSPICQDRLDGFVSLLKEKIHGS